MSQILINFVETPEICTSKDRLLDVQTCSSPHFQRTVSLNVGIHPTITAKLMFAYLTCQVSFLALTGIQALELAYSSSNLENSIFLVNYTMLCILGNSF